MISVCRLLLFLALLSPPAGINQLIKEPEFIDVRNFGFGQLSLKQSVVSADMYYFNPNGFQMQLKRIDLDVYVENRYAGKTSLDTLIFVPARDTFFVPVDMLVEMKNLFPNMLSLLTKDEIGLRVEGKVRVGKGGLFINVPVKYSGQQVLRVQKRKPPVMTPGDSTHIDSINVIN
jgi:LEA14-like dessication related protein